VLGGLALLALTVCAGSTFAQGYARYQVGDGPSALLSIDLDADGDQDLVVGNQLSASVSILVNRGDGTFELIEEHKIGVTPMGSISLCAFGRRRDGMKDIVVGYSAAHGFTLLLNTHNTGSDSMFRPLQVFALGIVPTGAAVADFDGRGNLDLALTTRGRVAISYNLASDDYHGPAHYEADGHLLAPTAADFNGDGWTDLAVVARSTDEDTNVYLLMNAGDGTFSDPVAYRIGKWMMTMVAADFDGDGDVDLMGSRHGNKVWLLENKGDGTFGRTRTRYYPGRPHSLFVADLDGDGDPDVAGAPGATDDVVRIMMNEGDGDFEVAGEYSTQGRVWSVAGGDFDADGDVDLAVAQGENDSVVVLMNKGNGAF
jgi:hypothetical protein